MRPPEFTGGNSAVSSALSYPELASMRPPEFTGGNPRVEPRGRTLDLPASMRPPEFTGGNTIKEAVYWLICGCFNEAAGIHRRKLGRVHPHAVQLRVASMRPPEFTGGNSGAAARS